MKPVAKSGLFNTAATTWCRLDPPDRIQKELVNLRWFINVRAQDLASETIRNMNNIHYQLSTNTGTMMVPFSQKVQVMVMGNTSTINYKINFTSFSVHYWLRQHWNLSHYPLFLSKISWMAHWSSVFFFSRLNKNFRKNR